MGNKYYVAGLGFGVSLHPLSASPALTTKGTSTLLLSTLVVRVNPEVRLLN